MYVFLICIRLHSLQKTLGKLQFLLYVLQESVYRKSDIQPEEISLSLGHQQMSLENNNPEILPDLEVSLNPIPLEETMVGSVLTEESFCHMSFLLYPDITLFYSLIFTVFIFISDSSTAKSKQ